MAEVVTVPLFVLPMGIFPMCQEPLRVFEPRYKQMLDDCVLNNSQFGYIAANIDGEVKMVGHFLLNMVCLPLRRISRNKGRISCLLHMVKRDLEW